MPNKFFWAGFSIIAMWLSVLFIGLYADADLILDYASGTTVTIPVVLGLAVCATIATMFVAYRGFRSD